MLSEACSSCSGFIQMTKVTLKKRCVGQMIRIYGMMAMIYSVFRINPKLSVFCIQLMLDILKQNHVLSALWVLYFSDIELSK
jgi:hypothetical protein